ncbi:hypothetical protein OROGR_025250 [Orobanche gracilis]
MKERDIVIDIESCLTTIKESGCLNTSTEELSKDENTVVNPLTNAKNVYSETENNAKKEKRFSVSAKKPPKPPRPPRGLSLDAADRKLVKEISELTLIKRARIERMKALRKIKAAKASSGSTSSSGNLIAMVFTILFFVVIIFQGCHPKTSNSSSDGVVGTQTRKGATEGNFVGFGSPSSADLAPGLDNKDEVKNLFVE